MVECRSTIRYDQVIAVLEGNFLAKTLAQENLSAVRSDGSFLEVLAVALRLGLTSLVVRSRISAIFVMSMWSR